MNTDTLLQPVASYDGRVSRTFRVFHKELRQFLEELRVKKGWTERQSWRIAQNRGIPISRQVLYRLYKGNIKNPSQESLQAVATLYGIDYSDLARRVFLARFGEFLAGRLADRGTPLAAADTSGGLSESTAPHPAQAPSDPRLIDIGTTLVEYGDALRALGVELLGRQAAISSGEPPGVFARPRRDRRSHDPARSAKRSRRHRKSA